VKTVVLGSCSTCGSRVAEAKFEAGMIEGPSENGFSRNWEPCPPGDKLTLLPCGCTFKGADARAELERVLIDTP
jgi:hypothetical protein